MIDVAVVELTNRCGIYENFSHGSSRGCYNCSLNKFHREFSEIDYDLLMRILNENDKMKNPIRTWELGWNGDPLLHSKISDILNEMVSRKLNINIVTNGYEFEKKIKPIEDMLGSVYLTFFLDSPDGDNDFLMAPGILSDTVEAFEYLKSIGKRFSVLMRMSSYNYNKIGKMLNFVAQYGGNLIPFEMFEGNMTNYQKLKTIEDIDALRKDGVHKTITFENPEGNCTYLRKLRIFINSRGYMSFCHFISFLDTELVDLKEHTLEEAIEINNRIRDEFVKRKMDKLKFWVKPRIVSSPCSFCYKTFGGKKSW